MAVTDFFAGEIATEILRMLIIIIRKACLCKYSAEQLILTINELLPIIHEIKYSGVELTATRQHQLDAIFGALHDGHEIAGKVLNSSRWNVYKSLKLSRKMDKLEKRISKFVQGPLQACVLAHVHHLRFESMDRRSESMEPMDRRSESMEQMDRLDGSFSRVEQRLGSMMICGGGGGGGWWSEAVVRMEEEEVYEGSLVKVGMELGKRRVKDMILDRDDLSVIGINGIGGSGKTTLAREICRDDDVQNDVKYFNGLCYFNFQSISSATNNFSSTNLLGKGGFGEVYKGKLVDGQEVAVKRLSRSSGQGVKEFKNEMELIAKLQHTNLVRLLGFCVEKQEKILVYEYMSNNSLDFFLFDPKKKGLLDWNNRFVIIDGIAQGLLYLHKFSRLRIIHRDLKAGNILLDDYLKPKISDFGMAKLFGINESEANTSRPVGTRGYMPPEYLIDGIISTKIDVFGFGVLLLETISSKRNHVSYDEGHPLNLLGLAWELWNKGRGLELMDPLLEDTCSPKEVMTCIHVGLLCVQDHATDRPTMSEVISMLTNENMHLPEPKQPAFFVERGETWTRVVQKARGSKLGLVARLIKARIKLATKT